MDAKSYILNYIMWTAANFIIEGRMRPQVVHRCFRPVVPKVELGIFRLRHFLFGCFSFSHSQTHRNGN